MAKAKSTLSLTDTKTQLGSELKVHEDGSYYIQKRSHNKLEHNTLQITPKGEDILRRFRLSPGDRLPEHVYEELRIRSCLETKHQSAPKKGARVAASSKSKPVTATKQTHGQTGEIVSRAPKVAVADSSSVPHLLVKVEGEGNWSLAMSIPRLRVTNSDERLRLEHECIAASETLPFNDLTTVTVVDACKSSSVLLVDPSKDRYSVYLFNRKAPNSKRESGLKLDGLRPVGTLFDVESNNRLPRRAALSSGRSYFVLRSDKVETCPMPPSILKCTLASHFDWTLYLAKVPDDPGSEIRSWARSLDHPTIE